MPNSPGKSEWVPLVVVASSVGDLRKRCRQALSNGYSIHETADRSDSSAAWSAAGPRRCCSTSGCPASGARAASRPSRSFGPPPGSSSSTGAPDEREGIAILKAGARGYCHRDIDGPLLEKATDVVLKGEIWVGRKLIPHLLEELTVLTEQRRRETPGKGDERLGRVTPRERQIVDLLSVGRATRRSPSA